MKLISSILACAVLSGCATSQLRKSVLLGAGVGAAAGATGGALFSPNDESRGLNSIVFGLSGAVIGGLIGLWTGSPNEPEVDNKTLQEKEFEAVNSTQIMINAPNNEKLPEFVRERLSKLVIEELNLPDRVGEDGALHEPHKAYRVKRSPELFSSGKKAKEGSKK